MASHIYTVFFLISFFMLIYLVSEYKDMVSVYYPMLFMSICIALMGYYQMSTVTDVNQAINANQIVYMGACFTPFFLMLCMADLCKVKFPKICSTVFLVYAITIFALISTTNTNKLYYTNMSVIQRDGISFVIKEYGPFHTMYPIYLFSVMIICLCMILNSLVRRKDVSYVTSLSLLMIMLMVVIVYIYEKTMNIEYELIPFVYVISQGAMVFLLKRISLYDIVKLAAEPIVESNDSGFVICDNKGKYLGADDTAKEWFSEIADLPIESKIELEESDLLYQIGRWIRGEDENNTDYFERDGKTIKAEHWEITVKKKRKVHCIYLVEALDNNEQD